MDTAKTANKSVTNEFRLAREIRKKCLKKNPSFELSGETFQSDFTKTRIFTQLLNENRINPLYASDVNAFGLIHETFRNIIEKYRLEIQAESIEAAKSYLIEQLSVDKINEIFLEYVSEFPNTDVLKKHQTHKSYLNGETNGIPNRELIVEDLLILWIENQNPALKELKELFDDQHLAKNTVYSQFNNELKRLFANQPGFGQDNLNLFELLQMPAKFAPNSIQKQLEYIRDNWGHLLGDFLQNILRALDFISEEKKMRGGGGPGKIAVPEYYGDDEYERFSIDRDWMPNVVMIAKNVYVWMDQLSKQYRENIIHLHQIPDEELDRLAKYGFTALWLIGLWERSKASKKIKQMCGNPEAEASAYSLMGYEIANDIGGWEAFHNLKERCLQRGIRMASDMVPNHSGIDSTWVIEHPEWFLSLDYSPYPSYRFNGTNLSDDERVGIFIEDKYYSRQDAAVVFKRMDYWTGTAKYIYHGNDGTSMPWNDTAQLDYLNPEVREVVIQTILHVARNFPIIRFDAAMTLAKRHLQRLWYPEPGSGSDIPSRAEFGLSKSDFNQKIPYEFWREVVDRVAKEVPDTLLLAEAFWMMESYFVRTLGMHRVYNSAFMNMIKMERNADYRATIKKTLEFDPEILKRFVNFLNNPDEDTAALQFGKGDKYFGATLLIITMPGLPMFGHNQIEGFEEKYGMEYRKAYWDEQPDANFIKRHDYDIFPIMHKRYLFSGVDNFYLYDFYNSDGNVNENVFAYSNRSGSERALIFYNNSFDSCAGWVRLSVSFKNKLADRLENISVADGLNLTTGSQRYLIFREHKSNLEYIHKVSDIFTKGIYAELNGYQYQIIWNMYEVEDNEFGHYAKLHERLGGRGVKSIDEELQLKFKKKYDFLYVSAEVAPFSKAGGLADVAAALPREIAKKGNHIAVITPFYSIIEEEKYSIKFTGITGSIQMGEKHYDYEIHQYNDENDVDYFFVKNDYFFKRGGIYTDKNGEGFDDNNERYFLFQYVILDLIERGLFSVNLIHCNDHHSALIPWMLKNRTKNIPTLLTIHNAEYQGQFNIIEMNLLQSMDFQKRDKRLKNFNSLAIGIKYSDALNTVSPNYAKELLIKDRLTFGLKNLLNTNKNKFSGIINGADYTIWNSQTDSLLDDHFSIKSLAGKNKNKRRLLKKCDWIYSNQPVIGMVSRLVTTKGFNLLLKALDKIVATKAKLVILGTGNIKIVKSLKKFAGKYPDQISFHNYFDEKMAHLIEAGSDMFLMPSRSEPCGLNQIYSLRYGTIPIVFNTGGLADTVVNWNETNGNGFVFYRFTTNELIKIIQQAVEIYNKKSQWKTLVKNAMNIDYSWSNSAEKYLNLYTQILKENSL